MTDQPARTTIPFTQYLRPDGRRRPLSVTVSEELGALAHELLEKGFHFDIEELQTGMVSMTCEKGEIVAGHEICPNGPGIDGFIEKLVRSAYDNKDKTQEEDDEEW